MRNFLAALQRVVEIMLSLYGKSLLHVQFSGLWPSKCLPTMSATQSLTYHSYDQRTALSICRCKHLTAISYLRLSNPSPLNKVKQCAMEQFSFCSFWNVIFMPWEIVIIYSVICKSTSHYIVHTFQLISFWTTTHNRITSEDNNFQDFVCLSTHR
jgi:hypothetical protein